MLECGIKCGSGKKDVQEHKSGVRERIPCLYNRFAILIKLKINNCIGESMAELM